MSKTTINLFIKFSYGTILSALLGFITTMITTELFSPESFGILSIFTSIISLVTILSSLGTDHAIIRFYNDESAESSISLFKKTIMFPLVSFLIVTILALIMWDNLSYSIFGEKNFTLVFIIIVTIFFEIMFRYLILYIRMQKKANLYSILQILHKLFYLIFILTVSYFSGYEYKSLILSFTLSLVSVTTVGYLFNKNLVYGKIKVTSNTRNSDIFKYSLPFMITMFVTILFESIDKFFIKYFYDFYEVGVYSAAYKIITLVSLFQGMLSTFLIPLLYEKYNENSEDKLFFSNVTRYVNIIMMIVGVLVIGGKDILIKLFASEYSDASQVIPYLMFYPIFYTISETTMIGINFKKRPIYHLIISLITLLISILLNYLLVPHLGAVGASMATAVTFVFFFIFRTFFSQRLFKYSIGYIRLSISTLILTLYSTFSVFYSDFYTNIIACIIVLSILCLLYLKDISRFLVMLKNIYFNKGV